MGMGASQARFVTLTGRQNDVEFQGQQINQQRTTLATESAAYNNSLLNITVPTPPSADQYTKTTYTMTANGQTYDITGTQYQANAYYIDPNGAIINGANPNPNQPSYAGGTYAVHYTTDQTTTEGKSSGSQLFSSSTDPVTNVVTYRTSQQTPLTQVVINPADPNYNPTDISNTALITQDCNLPANSAYYKYTSDGVTKYVTAADLQASANTTTAVPAYYVDDNATDTQGSIIGGAQVTWDDSGRMTSITDSEGNNYSLSVATADDTAAYNDATNEYEYQQALYNNQMDQINARICVIQSEDKKLELKLKDLDTQQQAIQTEVDAVKKVIDKNIEQSFKTFA